MRRLYLQVYLAFLSILLFFAVLVAAGIWLLGTMADVRKVQDCAAQGRRNCGTIDVPAR